MTFEHQGHSFSDEEAKADAIFEYYNNILGTYFTRARNINLAQIGMPQLDLSDLADEFTEDEAWAVIKEIPNDQA